MRWLVLALGVVTVALWWMLFDLWPTLPKQVPLLHWRADRADWLDECCVATWFGPPAVVTLVAWGGAWLGPWILWRARTGSAVPWRRWRQVRLLPAESRCRVVQPLRLAVTFAACCLVIQVGVWYAAIEDILQDRVARRAGQAATLGAMFAGLGAGLTLARVRALREAEAFVAAGGRLGDP